MAHQVFDTGSRASAGLDSDANKNITTRKKKNTHLGRTPERTARERIRREASRVADIVQCSRNRFTRTQMQAVEVRGEPAGARLLLSTKGKKDVGWG